MKINNSSLRPILCVLWYKLHLEWTLTYYSMMTILYNRMYIVIAITCNYVWDHNCISVYEIQEIRNREKIYLSQDLNWSAHEMFLLKKWKFVILLSFNISYHVRDHMRFLTNIVIISVTRDCNRMPRNAVSFLSKVSNAYDNIKKYNITLLWKKLCNIKKYNITLLWKKLCN